MASSTESNLEAAAQSATRQGKRFGCVTLGLVTLAAFWAGGVVRNRMATSFEADLLAAFPGLMEINSPVTIQMDWNASVKQEISEKFDLKVYAGPATYTVKNKSDRPTKIVFPPQNCFNFRVKELHAETTPRSPENIPAWAKNSFVLSLRPGEERRFDDVHAMTSARAPGEFEYGPFAFDFAAPGDANPTDFLTGTVLCTMKANVAAQ